HHITEDEAEAFRRAVYLKYQNQGSRNDLVCVVRAMVRGACRRSLISAARRELLLDKLYTRTPARSAKGRLLKDDEVSRLLEACSSTCTSIARSRNVAIVALLRTSGMRSCELVSLELKDWDRENDTLTLRDTKNGSTHTVFLHPEA